MGINPISEEATRAFFANRRITPAEWELDGIDAIETAFLNDYHEQQESSKPKKKP